MYSSRTRRICRSAVSMTSVVSISDASAAPSAMSRNHSAYWFTTVVSKVVGELKAASSEPKSNAKPGKIMPLAAANTSDTAFSVRSSGVA